MTRRSSDTPDRHETNPDAIIFLNERGEIDTHCVPRDDSSGFKNFCKAWYLYLLHLGACGILFVSLLVWIDKRNFNTGSPRPFFQSRSGLFQVEVNFLISAALVLIRFLGDWCTSLLVWRMIFILLAKRGITLKDILRLGAYRLPSLSRLESRRSLSWTCMAVMAIVLLWPPMIAAPLATSSVAWIPSTRPSTEPQSLSLAKIDQNSDWNAMNYAGVRAAIVVNAASLALRDPLYAFNRTSIPTRRHFSLRSPQYRTGVASLHLPYIDVSFRWIDASSDNKSAHAGDAKFSDISGNSWELRRDGTMEILRDREWNLDNIHPEKPRIFDGKKTVAVKVATLEANEKLRDGSFPTAESPCPAESRSFSELPDVELIDRDYYWSNETRPFLGKDCFLLAEASIKAGLYLGNACNISSAGSEAYFATCTAPTSPIELTSDWLTELTLDTVSEVMRYFMVLSMERPHDSKGKNPWIGDDLEDYMSGMLTLAYHATWSSYVEMLGRSANETITAVPSEEVVTAFVDRDKVLGWLFMNITLALSAAIVCVAQDLSGTKTVRDVTVAALTMDLSEITHSHDAPGLCNAVTLRKEDEKLRRMKWSNVGSEEGVSTGMERTLPRGHCHRVRFVEEVNVTHAAAEEHELVSLT